MLERLSEIVATPIEPLPPDYPFKPAVPEVPLLARYDRPAPPKFWKKFPKDTNIHKGSPYEINTRVLSDWVEKSNPSSTTEVLLEEVVHDIEHGADLALKEGYVPTRSKNAKSAALKGKHVTDTVALGVKNGIYCGPFDTCPKNATVNSVQTAPKPRGKVRIIMNHSMPKGSSVNDFVVKDRYPAYMGGMKEILWALNFVGVGAWFAKVDWNQAYKHLSVMARQRQLQWFLWLGKYFFERCLIFGTISSVGLYDRFARLIVLIAVGFLSYPSRLVIQHLDDVCVIGKEGMVNKFYDTYREICSDTGVSLQEPRDAAEDKAFGPTQRGSMLGVWFDTNEWIWWIANDKVVRYVHSLQNMLKVDLISQREIWSVVGKVLYVAYLIPGSKYHISELLKINSQFEDGNEMVLLSKRVKSQLKWWIPMVRLAGRGLPIPKPYDACPVDALEADSDAAGGSKKPGAGCGIIFGKAWTQVFWPEIVNSEAKCLCGAKYKHQLSLLELVGHLLHVSVFPEEVMNRVIRTNIDNAGTVVNAKKGRSLKCQLTDSLVRAINHIAVALNARAYVEKVERCSTREAKAADALSKSDFKKFKELCPDAESLPRPIPKTVRYWIANPTPDNDLGRKVCLELRANGIPVLDSMC